MEFKQTHGHCRVPMNIPELGKWAKYQRDQYVLHARGKKAKITKEKINMLTSIGFEDSLEERVVLGLPGEKEKDGGGLHEEGQHFRDKDEAHLQQAHQHHGELHAEHYQRGDPGADDGVHSAQPDSSVVNYYQFNA